MGAEADLTVVGAGNIGRAIALGLSAAGRFAPERMILTRRKPQALDDLSVQGFQVQSDNRDAVRRAAIVLVAVEPLQLDTVLQEVRADLDPARHLVISVVSGASIAEISRQIDKPVPVVRAMPNTGISLGRSMTCLATNSDRESVRETAVSIFDAVGLTLMLEEELMSPATALCACGIAFFLRAIRAAAQGGIEIGFHPAEAMTMAAQTALGAASLALQNVRHPEGEIDRVTTPRGCTISGLNEMEHQGFSSAMIRGITLSAEKAARLYAKKSD